jgi:hypothetical protein
MSMKYNDRKRTTQSFVLTGLEHRGVRAKNERLVCHVQGTDGLLAIWGESGGDMKHIEDLEHAITERGFPIEVECDWIEPDDYEATHFGHRYWVWQTDRFAIRRAG